MGTDHITRRKLLGTSTVGALATVGRPALADRAIPNRPGYGIVDCNADGSFSYRYHEYGWRF